MDISLIYNKCIIELDIKIRSQLILSQLWSEVKALLRENFKDIFAGDEVQLEKPCGNDLNMLILGQERKL